MDPKRTNKLFSSKIYWNISSTFVKFSGNLFLIKVIIFYINLFERLKTGGYKKDDEEGW